MLTGSKTSIETINYLTGQGKDYYLGVVTVSFSQFSGLTWGCLSGMWFCIVIASISSHHGIHPLQLSRV